MAAQRRAPSTTMTCTRCHILTRSSFPLPTLPQYSSLIDRGQSQHRAGKEVQGGGRREEQARCGGVKRMHACMR